MGNLRSSGLRGALCERELFSFSTVLIIMFSDEHCSVGASHLQCQVSNFSLSRCHIMALQKIESRQRGSNGEPKCIVILISHFQFFLRGKILMIFLSGTFPHQIYIYFFSEFLKQPSAMHSFSVINFFNFSKRFGNMDFPVCLPIKRILFKSKSSFYLLALISRDGTPNLNYTTNLCGEKMKNFMTIPMLDFTIRGTQGKGGINFKSTVGHQPSVPTNWVKLTAVKLNAEVLYSTKMVSQPRISHKLRR